MLLDIYGYSDKEKYLHTWVEGKLGYGFPVVIDYTMNALMNKDGYYFLQKPKILSRISGKDLEMDNKFIRKFAKTGATINDKEYLVFRDEIMRYFNRNKQLFDEEGR